MIILFVSHYSGFYGASKSMYALMLDLRQRYGVTPIVLMPNKGALCDELDKVDITYYVSHYYWWVNYNRGFFQKLLNKRKQLLNWMNISKLVSIVKNDKIDLVYSNSVTVNIGMFMAERMNVPHIWQFRESLSQFNLSLSLSLSKFLLKRVVNRKYILISDYMMSYYSNYLPKDRMIRIYNGINVPSDVRSDNELQQGILNLCMVGIICEQKNQLDAVKAVALLKQKGLGQVKLHLIGTVGSKDYLATINSYIATNGLQEQVKLCGHQSDINAYLAQMNVGLMCSRDEAFGRVTIEYMAQRMPVIASISGANAELIHDDMNGFLYPLYNASALAIQIEKFLDNTDLLDVMGKRAYQTALQFSVTKNTDAIYEQIQNVLNN